jgi:hypothetical protein
MVFTIVFFLKKKKKKKTKHSGKCMPDEDLLQLATLRKIAEFT